MNHRKRVRTGGLPMLYGLFGLIFYLWSFALLIPIASAVSERINGYDFLFLAWIVINGFLLYPGIFLMGLLSSRNRERCGFRFVLFWSAASALFLIVKLLLIFYLFLFSRFHEVAEQHFLFSLPEWAERFVAGSLFCNTLGSFFILLSGISVLLLF